MKKQRLITIVVSLAVSAAVLVLLLVLGLLVPSSRAAPSATSVFINEIHYDNASTDQNEGIEIAGPAGTDFSGWDIVLYNGNGGALYNTVNLSGVIPDQQNGFGTIFFAISGIQNGAPDGVALVHSSTVVQFLSYEGSFTATDGPANEMTSTDIGVSESGSTPVGHSLQLIGTGSVYEDFVWSGPIANTYDAVNTGQTFEVSEFAVSKSASSSMVQTGDVLTYTIWVANTGVGGTANNVVITDALPISTTWAWGGSYTNGVISFTTPSTIGVDSAISVTFAVTVEAPYGSSVVNESYGVYCTEVPTPTMGTPVTTIVSALDLLVDKSGPDYAVIGENIVYAITLNNVGVTTATNVVLTDTLPVSTTYVSDTSGVIPTNPSPRVYVWSLGDVSSGTVTAFNLTVTVDSGVTGGTTLTNTVEASTDTTGDNPANNTAQWETTAYPLVSIHDIQFVPDPASDDASPYKDQIVCVEGVVVAGTGEIGYSGNNFVVEDSTGGPWSGLIVYNSGTFPDVFEGDYVRLLGKVAEYNGMTEFDISAAPNAQQVISTGNPLPAPEVIATGDFVNDDTAEQWESVLIEFQDATVTDENLGYGEWAFDDGSEATRADDFGANDGDMTYIPELGDVYNFIRGIGWYSYSDYKLQPRYDADIALKAATPATTKDAPVLVAPGAPFTYTITVENELGFTLDDVVITDAVPANATFAYALDGGGESGGVVSWTVASLPSESNITARFVVTATTDLATITNADYAIVASNFVTPTVGAPVATVVDTRLAIHHIQGAGHVSPLVDRDVEDIHGIVTAKRGNGFYMQDPNPDSDVATSEAIYVYTGSVPSVNVGDEVLVSGIVAEFRYKASHLSMTRIEEPTVVVSSTGNPLPAPIVIGTGGRIPPQQVIDDDATGDVETSGTFDPATDGIDFYESLEAMLVQVNYAVAVGPTSYGVIPVVGDNGDNAGLLTPRGGIVVQADDFNPERILVDDAIVWSEPSVNVGASFTGPITGVIDYNDYDGNFNLLNVNTLPATSGGVVSETTTAPTTSQLRVASFNVYNLDPNPDDGDDDSARFEGLAGQIVDNLQAPDIIGLQEIQDNSGETNDGVVDATATCTTLIAAIQTAGGPTYEFCDVSPEDGKDGGAPGGNIRVGFLFRTDRGLTFVDRHGAVATTTVTVTMGATGTELSFSPGRIDPTNSAFNDSRKPLVGEFLFNGRKMFVVVNHFNSKGGDDALFGHTQPPVLYSEVQRLQQAQVVNGFVDSILALDANANVIVLGDLNDFQFSTPVSDTLAADVLTNLMSTLPITEQYTYIYDGNSQVLDHILVSDNLFQDASIEFDVVHVNAEFAYSSSRPSDHDPVVATFTLLRRVYLPLVMRQY